jgi:hypothetical protein
MMSIVRHTPQKVDEWTAVKIETFFAVILSEAKDLRDFPGWLASPIVVLQPLRGFRMTVRGAYS